MEAAPRTFAPLGEAPQRCSAVLFGTTPLLLDSGQVVSDVRVAYHTYGTPSRDAVLVLHALTGDSAVHQWWPGLFGAGQALDSGRDFIVCSNVLGGCTGTSGPAELGTDELSLRDMVCLQRELLRHLGVERVSVVGGSMGGMQAYAWLNTFPDLVNKAVIIGAPARHSPWATGLNTAARSAILAAPGGAGLQVARQIAMLSYRSPQSFAQTQAGPSSRRAGQAAISTYLEYQGQKLADRFCERSYLALTNAMDRFQLTNAELNLMQTRTLVVGISSDQLYPAWEVREQAGRLRNAIYWELESPHGHDAFLMDASALDEQVKAFLEG
ncbi:alpha/beta fold hydrolase family protein [Deinococcus rubellus]|uniref:Homoserine O-acetyltransferase n=1 Tax=Deinococcus rubellus TaxID=1889240 RepID=A0ABY5YKI1_9DEIO|nr:alpha/beta fold hydrolase family protein [Deinococcus rubellus]UWX65609.1 alpha/beta fold hydrolase family protein [Deinococcus rubellus]